MKPSVLQWNDNEPKYETGFLLKKLIGMHIDEAQGDGLRA